MIYKRYTYYFKQYNLYVIFGIKRISADMEMSTLNSSYTFKSLAYNRHDRLMCAFALCDSTIKDVTPSSWTGEFKSELTRCKGALILIAKEDSSADIDTALMTYDSWRSAGTRRLKSFENRIKYNYVKDGSEAGYNVDQNNDTNKIVK